MPGDRWDFLQGRVLRVSHTLSRFSLADNKEAAVRAAQATGVLFTPTIFFWGGQYY